MSSKKYVVKVQEREVINDLMARANGGTNSVLVDVLYLETNANVIASIAKLVEDAETVPTHPEAGKGDDE